MAPLPVVALANMTTKVRMARLRGRCTALPVLRAGAAVSGGATRAKSRPAPMEISPGTTKAARQPKYFTRKPVDTAANAMPRLPASPLMPMVRPGRGDCCSSMGMPTGW